MWLIFSFNDNQASQSAFSTTRMQLYVDGVTGISIKHNKQQLLIIFIDSLWQIDVVCLPYLWYLKLLVQTERYTKRLFVTNEHSLSWDTGDLNFDQGYDQENFNAPMRSVRQL